MQNKKKHSNNLKDRLKASKNEYEKGSFMNNFKMGEISGDTNVRNIKISDLISAPDEWNFYKPLSDEKMSELIDSILKNGLLHPIVVWEQVDGKYMILAGHNRVRAYQYLYESSQDQTYAVIAALIKREKEITEEEAREIIIDTNWVQRQLSAIEKSRSIIEKYTVLRNKSNYESKKGEYGQGRLRDIVAEQYQISGRQVEEYRRLSRLITEFKELLMQNKISFTIAAKLSLFNADIQTFIYQNYRGKLRSKYIRKLNSTMGPKEIKMIFNETTQKEKMNLKFSMSKDIVEKYNHLSNEEKELISLELENLINTLTE